MPLVKYNAERIWRRCWGVDLDDLISAGVFGLMDAIGAVRPDPGRAKFETYCVPRIRGAMLDELRTMDWVPRLRRIEGHQDGGEPVKSWKPNSAALPPKTKLLDLLGLPMERV